MKFNKISNDNSLKERFNSPIIILDMEGRDEKTGGLSPSGPLRSCMRDSASLSRPFSFVPMFSAETAESTEWD